MSGATARAGQEEFRALLAEDLEWKPFAAFPPEVRLALLVGQPSKQGPYTIRVRVPHGVKLMPEPSSFFPAARPTFIGRNLANTSPR